VCADQVLDGQTNVKIRIPEKSRDVRCLKEELLIGFGSLDELNGLIEKLRKV